MHLTKQKQMKRLKRAKNKKKNLNILAFTINNSYDLSKAQKLGLDGIFTDDPYLKLSSASL